MMVSIRHNGKLAVGKKTGVKPENWFNRQTIQKGKVLTLKDRRAQNLESKRHRKRKNVPILQRHKQGGCMRAQRITGHL